jgi:hypothetical protein
MTTVTATVALTAHNLFTTAALLDPSIMCI